MQIASRNIVQGILTVLLVTSSNLLQHACITWHTLLQHAKAQSSMSC